LGRPAVVQDVMPPCGLDQFRDDDGHLPVGMLSLEEFDEVPYWPDKVPLARVDHV
jgi:hypothetical protein